jgi:hypothetical protein
MARAWLRIKISVPAGWVSGAGRISSLDLGEVRNAALFSMLVLVGYLIQWDRGMSHFYSRLASIFISF